MIVSLTFKTPDVVFNATQDLSEEEKEEARAACEEWVEYDEYLTIDIDTKTGECTPLKVC